MNLNTFLANKPLYYNEIDYERMPRVYEKIKSHFLLSKIIHIIGTNGKGTTGRFLATALYHLGFKVGHYTSPHIIDFNERIWMNAELVASSALESAHQKLQAFLTTEDASSLSYFEYTTFLAMLIFDGCDYIVLEAGLGGEHDATAVFPKVLTLVTPISYDHEAFLGSNIRSIAQTKLNAVQNNAIIAVQKNEEVYAIANELAIAKSLNIFRVDRLINSTDITKIEEISSQLALVEYLSENLKLSIACLNFLGIIYEVKHFKNARLFGRLTKLQDNITIDVGHNPLAARSIAKALQGEKFTLIYNSYEDKDYEEILKILYPLITHVELIQIDDSRIERESEIQKVLSTLKIKNCSFKNIEENQKYLVFGSFKVVEEFLKVYNE